MTTLFFLLTVIFVMYEINVLSKTTDSITFAKKMKEKDFWRSEIAKEDKSRGCLLVSIQMAYMVWVVIGVALASQWQIFMLLLSAGVVHKLISKIAPEDDLVISKKINATASIVILLWIFMNHFHPGIFPLTLI